MDTLPQDLIGLFSRHFTSVEDVLVSNQTHNKHKNIKMAVQSTDWKSMMHFLQKYEYQDQTLADCYSAAQQCGDSKLTNFLIGRYGHDIKIASGTITQTKSERRVNDRKILTKKIKRDWGIKEREMKWIFGYLGRIPEIIADVSNETDFEIICMKMINHFTDNPKDHDTLRCWAVILALLDRIDDLEAFVKFAYKLAIEKTNDGYIEHRFQKMSEMILSASIRTNNVELFIKFAKPNFYDDMNDTLTDAFHFDAHAVVKHIFEVYDPKVYVYHWGKNRPISSPRIARMIVNHKGLKITGLSDLINSCEMQNYNVVAKILSTLL